MPTDKLTIITAPLFNKASLGDRSGSETKLAAMAAIDPGQESGGNRALLHCVSAIQL